jgi:hypothetical protein
LVVEVAAAFGLPLAVLAAVAGGPFGGPFDLGGGELQAGPDLVGLDLGHRPPGPLAFVWPAGQNPATGAEIDARLVLEAADRATTVWPTN